ncbi:MAG: hypothetical protein QXL10_02975 [Candidatus Bathyarchaeia archaeon]
MSKSQNDKLEIIKSLLLDEKAIGEVNVFKVTVLQSIIEYEKTLYEKTEDFKDAVLDELKKIKPFSPRQRSSLSEGFIQFKIAENKADFYYVREVAFRWEYANASTDSIQSLNVKRIDSAYRVRINVLFENKKVTLSFFGGVETLVYRARRIVCDAVKRQIQNFVTTDLQFSPKQMQELLSKFGKDVALINIDPRDNEKFSKIVERKVKGKTEVKKVVLYDVFNFRMSGVQIVNSPEVSRLIKEENIRLTEISGRLSLPLDVKITCRIKSNGRVEFVIPSKYFGTDTNVIYDKAVEFYGKLLSDAIKPEKGPLEKFF